MRTVNLAGREFPTSIRAWEPVHRREASMVVLAITVVLVVSGLVLWFMLEDATLLLWVFLALLGVLLLAEGAIHALGPKAARAVEGPDAGGAAAAEPSATISLKCGQCGTVFDLADPGTRPLYHTCPGCGAEGVLGATAAPEAAPVAPAAPVAEARKPLRKLKLRCGACQTVFVVEDFGERPLRHSCPGCGRAGELR